MARPFIWTWLVAIPLTLLNAVRATSARIRALGLVLFGLSLSLFLLESAFALYHTQNSSGATMSTGTYESPGYYVAQPDLGYAVKPGARVTSRKTRGAREIYDVVYTFSDLGQRVTRGNPRGNTWLFMGCSFTFGEGVDDDETLAALFSAELGHSANVVNLGLHGYGPHQMLRALEIGRLPGINPPVKQVIYQGMAAHVHRAAGRASWDPYGPAYRMSGDTVSYSGPFHSRFAGKLLQLVEKSDLARFFTHRLYFNDRASDDEIELYARILQRSANIAKRDLGAGFTIVFWDDDTDASRRVLARLRQTGIHLLKVSDVIPRRSSTEFAIPLDGHPTPEAYRRLAVALSARLAPEN